VRKQDRHDVICSIVHAAGRVRVSDLSTDIGVSEMTVRRDLEELEEKGLLTRVHGGAVSTVSRSFEPGFTARAQQNTEAKKRIGEAAAALVRDGETLIIDAGTTTLQVAGSLRPDLRLRVMALSLRVADVLADLPNVTLMIPGGVVRPHERSFVGGMTLTTFDELTFDTVVLTSGGVDVQAGVTEYEFDDAQTKRAALQSARRTIVVADGSKLGAVAFVRLCPIEQVDVVVTDTSAAPAQVAALRAAGVDVIVA
jgi:DeoR/GlpR family transcriptional regulator of sugar metabolism